MRRAIVVAALLIPSAAWADQEVRFANPAVVLHIPDDWSVEELAFENGFELDRPGEVYAGSIAFRDDITCAGTDLGESLEAAPEVAGWRGGVFKRGDDRAAYLCRDVELGGTAYQLHVEGPPGEIVGIAAIADDAIARGIAGGREIHLEAIDLTIAVPEGWQHGTNARGDDEFTYESGGYIGVIAVHEDDCAKILEINRNLLEIAVADVRPRSGWSGFDYYDRLRSSEPFGFYCLDVHLGERVDSLSVEGDPAVIPALMIAVEAGALAEIRRVEGATSEAWAGSPDHELDVSFAPYGRSFTLKMTVPEAWVLAGGDVKTFKLADGRVVGGVVAMAAGCDPEAPVDTAKWSMSKDGSITTYCRSFGILGDYSMRVFGPDGTVRWLVAAVSAALDVYDAPRKESPPSAFVKYGPTRYDLGLGRFTDGPDGFNFDEAWGLTLGAAYAPWRQKLGLTWSAEMHLTATGAGTPFTADAGVGVSAQFIALQGIVGVGAFGDTAGFAPHAGGQVDLMLMRRDWHGAGGGLDLLWNYAWLSGGTTTRIDGGFVFMFGRRGVAARFGYERRLDAHVIGLTIGTQTLPLPE